MNEFKNFRLELGISQFQLAEVTKVKRYKIQLVEQGIPCLSAEELSRILPKLGITKNVPKWAEEALDNKSK